MNDIWPVDNEKPGVTLEDRSSNVFCLNMYLHARCSFDVNASHWAFICDRLRWESRDSVDDTCVNIQLVRVELNTHREWYLTNGRWKSLRWHWKKSWVTSAYIFRLAKMALATSARSPVRSKRREREIPRLLNRLGMALGSELDCPLAGWNGIGNVGEMQEVHMWSSTRRKTRFCRSGAQD